MQLLARLNNKIRAGAAWLLEPVPAKPKAPAYPEDATPVLTPLGTPYMHVWLDNSWTPPMVCMTLRNRVTIRFDQRITQALAIALLKLPYTLDPPQPQEPDDNAK